MPPRVEVSEDTKKQLDELRAEIRLQTGREVPERELLDRVLTQGLESRGTIIETFRAQSGPLSDDHIQAVLTGVTAYGRERTDDE